MKSISRLFETTCQDIDSDHLDRMARRYRYFDRDCLDNVPKVSSPPEGTSEFKKDFNEVLRCHNNPSLTTKFLHDSDDSVQDVFQKYCKLNTKSHQAFQVVTQQSHIFCVTYYLKTYLKLNKTCKHWLH